MAHTGAELHCPCRLLQYSIQEAKSVIAPPTEPVTSFAEEQSPELRDRIFDEFNSLAVVYWEPASAFLKRAATQDLEVVEV